MRGDRQKQKRYDKLVLEVIQRYGSAMEAFGKASQGSPRGMEETMRLAQDQAREVLFAALGREPALAELSQIPPLYELPVVMVDATRFLNRRKRRVTR